MAGRTSSFHYRASTLTPAQIAGQLGVSHLVEGSVQRQGEKVRIHAHLIDGANGFELWGGRFDGVLDDIFELQEAVARGVTQALADALGIALQPPVVGNLTHSKEAYDLYLQGRFNLDDLMSREIALDGVEAGYELLKDPEVPRVVITAGLS